MKEMNIYIFIDTLFKFRKGCFDIFGILLVYNMFENVHCCSVNLSYCKKVTYSLYFTQQTDFMSKL